MPSSTLSYRIVIPVFNPSRELLENIGKLGLSNPGAIEHVLLVDDGSTNGVPQEVEKMFPGLTRIQGDGSLWWCGAMKVGMSCALEEKVDVIVWLNHDCVPADGTIDKLVSLAAVEGYGAVSAWCRSIEAVDFPVNPGFRNLTEIPVSELMSSDIVSVDGVNGNCVAINANAIRSVGLPDSIKHPHYGDGPYTYRLHKAGYHNIVCTSARAYLEREYDRCISVKWRCSFWNVPLSVKLRYYFLSRKSKFHFAIKYSDVVVFRGYPLAPIAYLASMLRVFWEIISGHQLVYTMSREARIDAVCLEYEGVYPREGMINCLTLLENA
jgi:GT2 family glycosyltransferase